MGADDIIKKYGLDSKTWTHKGFHGILHFFFPVGENPVKPLKEYYGDCHKLIVYYFDGTQGNWYWNDEDMERLRKSFMEKAAQDPKIIKKHRKDWESRLKDFKKIFRPIKKGMLRKLSNDDLLALYGRFYKSYIAEYGISIGIQDAFSMHADRFIEPRLREILKKKKLEENFNEYYGTLMSPISLSFIQKEEIDLMKMAKKKISGQDVASDLKKHARSFHFINNNYAKVQRLDAKYFGQKLDEMISRGINLDEEFSKMEKSIEETKQRKKELMKKLRLPKDFKLLIKISESFADTQDMRKMYVLIANYYQSLFIDEFGRRGKYTRDEMEFTIFTEMKSILEGKLSKEELAARREWCICIQTEDNFELLTGGIARGIINNIFIKKIEASDEITGSVACKGYAKGIAKIIHKTHDLVNFTEGDILVASMTRPEMTVAMKKAAAIVTDEGGVTSHAAVISRELNIPCIIGTKNATKIFKDGDLIEVDADKGIVRRL
jgi:phosphohistidine swiveling domain-containing protein